MTSPSQPPATWAAGDRYEPYVGRWSRRVAPEFLAWLAIPAGKRWLDVGCGTGALSQTILAYAQPAGVAGVDPSEGFLAFARARVPQAEFRVGDAQALTFEDDSFDAAVSGLVLNFVPDAAKAAGEMRRVVRPGGTAAAYVWDYAGEMQLMRRFWAAAVALDPAAGALDESHPLFAVPARCAARACGPPPACRTSRSAPSTCRPCSRTSTTTGRPSSAARARRRPTACRSPRITAHGCASTCTTRCPSRRDGSIRLIARAFAVRGRKRMIELAGPTIA